MPTEPLPCDRRDFLKERKHHHNSHHPNDRTSESLIGSSGGGSLPRWRDYCSSSHHTPEFSRWGSADFRRPPGPGKQGGWHLFAEESGHGYPSSRSGDKMLEVESTRIWFSHGDGKYGRNSRESRSSFSQRDWKGHSWDMSNGSSNTLGRVHDLNCDQMSVDDMLTHASHPQSDFVTKWDRLQLKDQHDNKMGGVNGLGTGKRCERESSLDWKPLKWTRSGSLSSWGLGLSHSSSSKSMVGVDSSEGKTDLQQKNATAVESPSGDAAAYLTSGAPSEETTSRKKLRLGWGEGLAKYEKKKVDGPYVGMIKDVAYISTSNADPVNSLSSNLAEKSPRNVGFFDCASPTTPSSVACSSSPGVEEKEFGRVANIDSDVSNLCASPSIGSQNHPDGFLFNLEKLDSDSITNLGSSVIELLQSDDPSLQDSSFVQSTAVNKLLIWEGDILKTLETTESEIDSLENELKLLKSGLGSASPCPATSTSLSVKENANHFKEQVTVSNSITRPVPLQIDFCGNASFGKMPDCGHVLEETYTNAKDEGMDSPGTATSKFVEPLSSIKPVSPSAMLKNVECSGVVDVIQSTNTEEKRTVPGSLEEEMTGVSACEDGDALVENKNAAPGCSDYSIYEDGENISSDIILCSNRESADEASEVFNGLLPRDLCNIDISGVANVLYCQNNSLIKEKFVKRKQFLRFKERVLTLKFKAFQHLWKEDLQLLAIRKYHAKSQKKSESSLRTTCGGYQKHRSSINLRFSSPAQSVSLVPTTEVIHFTRKLFSDSQVKVYRDYLKMPALILDNREKTVSKFISNNGLVEYPCAVEKERAIINPWTSEEREIFMDKLATFGKDFRKIASFLDYKTTADCVEFYYKNHKSDCFEKLKKQHDFSKQRKTCTSTYLVTCGKRNRKMNAASLDILGEASEMAAAAQADNCQLINSGRISLRGRGDCKTSLGDDCIIERSCSFDIIRSERETAAADVLAGICGSLSSEAISSCISSSVDPGDGQQEWKHLKVDCIIRQPSTSNVTQNVDDDTCSDESCGEMDPSDWTDKEKSIFIRAVLSYGKDFSLIARCVRTRSRDQCKAFFSKARKCLGLDLIRAGQGNVGTSVNDYANGGGGDTEDACVLETSSIGSGHKVGSKMNEDLPTDVMNMNDNESDPTGVVSLQTDLNKSEDDNRSEVLDDKHSKDECKAESMHFELESHSMNGAGDQLESLLAHKNTGLLAVAEGRRDQVTELGEVSLSAGEADDPCPSSSNAVEETNDMVAEVCTKGFGNDLEGNGLVLLAESMNDERDKNSIVETSGESEVLLSSNAPVNTLDQAVDTSFCSVALKLDSVDSPSVISLPQEKSLSDATFMQQDSFVIPCEKTLNQDRTLSLHDLKGGSKDKSVHKSVSSNDYDWNVSGHSLLNHVEYSQILKSYPLAIPTNKEMNGNINGRQLSEVPSILKADSNIDGPYIAQDCYIRKFNCSTSHSSITELPLLSQNVDQTSDHTETQACSLSDTEKSCKNGDVKLFGKILSHPLSLQQSNFSGHENEEKGTHHHKRSCKVANVKLTAHHLTDGGAAVLKLQRNNYVGLENVPVRRYGFWDWNRIQTGFSSLPDSAILPAKYPAAFSNYPTTSSKMEQQSLQAAVKSNECNLNGVAAVLPPREINSSNGVVDYQVYRSCDGTNVQPFTVDMKQRQELLLSEMQRRNAFKTLPSLQQQGNGMVGVNVVGRGGTLVGGGGPCTGVSDPVVAIRMHCAKNGGQSGSIREEESWIGKGDIGR